MEEIERKFLVKQLPDLSSIQVVNYERYYLFVGNGIELRIQRKNHKYELERKVTTGDLTRTGNSCPLSPEEFNLLKQLSSKSIIRDAYRLSESPNVSIKIYHGDCEGLVRAEFEFESEIEAKSFIPPEWCGDEVTNTALGRDSRLLALSRQDLLKELKVVESKV
jgi:CYTH domain-containing protein